MDPTIYLLHFIAFLDLFAVGLVVPLISNHVRELGGDYIYVGLLGSIYASFQLGSGPLIGSLSDIKGRRNILRITLLICGAAYALMGLTDSIFTIFAMRAVLGVFKQTQILTKALVPDYEHNVNKQSEIYGKMAAISGIGITLGPVIGGHIVEDSENGFTMITYIVGLCFVINAGLSSFLPQITKKPVRRKVAHDNDVPVSLIKSIVNSFRQSTKELYKVDWCSYWDIFLLKSLVGFSMGVYYSSYTYFIKDKYGLSLKLTGYVISFQGVVGSLSSYFIGFINSFYKHDTDYSQRKMHVFILLTISFAGLILSCNIYMFVIFLIPLSVSNAVGRLVTMEMLLFRSKGQHRGTLIGASNSVRSLSGVISPLVSGYTSEVFGTSYSISPSLISSITGLLISYGLRKGIKVD